MSGSFNVRVLGAVALVGVVSLVLSSAAEAAPASQSRKQVPPATIGEFSSLSAPALTGNALVVANQKQAQSLKEFATIKAQWATEAAGHASPAVCPVGDPGCTGGGGTPSTLTLSEPYYQQTYEYNCGAATTAMVASYLGVGWSGSVAAQQNSAGALLRTTTDGTAWEGADNVPAYASTRGAAAIDYPVSDALDYLLYKVGKYQWYIANPLPGTPTSAQQSAFVANLVTDINQHYPEADNQFSTANYNIGFQPNEPWQHWWSARGYANSGNTTYFNDPASWSQGRMSTATTTGGYHTVVMALGGRGYIW
jgi:hypothetical protein